MEGEEEEEMEASGILFMNWQGPRGKIKDILASNILIPRVLGGRGRGGRGGKRGGG